jgi:hypothetical protein
VPKTTATTTIAAIATSSTINNNGSTAVTTSKVYLLSGSGYVMPCVGNLSPTQARTRNTTPGYNKTPTQKANTENTHM